ncbi:hypothetical protein CLOM_g13578 [Closterium sp. NIES-68]|nr:hypothetical protein CLOM_g13578 [Closterium sp. NIES-68]
MGKAMFKGADGKMVGLKNVLWVPNLAANLISVRRLQKAGMDTSSKGSKTIPRGLIPGEPTNPKEAWEGPNGKEWKKASDEEMGSIIENDTFDLVNLPPGRKAISSKWLFKRKTDADGNIERYKSRLVAKG